jgi:hypothetical protein
LQKKWENHITSKTVIAGCKDSEAIVAAKVEAKAEVELSLNLNLLGSS